MQWPKSQLLGFQFSTIFLESIIPQIPKVAEHSQQNRKVFVETK